MSGDEGRSSPHHRPLQPESRDRRLVAAAYKNPNSYTQKHQCRDHKNTNAYTQKPPMPRPQKHQCLRAKTLVPAHPLWPQFPKLTCVGTGPRPCDDSGDDATLGHPLLAAERRLSRPSHSDTKASSVTRRRRDLGSRPGHGGGRGYMALHVARYVGISTLVPIVSSVCISLLREYISSVHSEYSNSRGVPPLVRHLGPDSYVGTIDCARLVTKARATCRLRKYDDSGVIQVWSECCRCDLIKTCQQSCMPVSD